MARIFLKETVDATRWVGTLVGFAGVMVVVQPGGAAFNPMWLVVLLSAAMFAPSTSSTRCSWVRNLSGR